MHDRFMATLDQDHPVREPDAGLLPVRTTGEGSHVMKSVEVKLRKYQRIKRKAKRSAKFNHFARLYWRYHFKVYGPHVNLWGVL